MLTESQWDDFDRDGYLHLGQLLDTEMVAALAQRANDLAAGTLSNPNIQMQMDTGGAYDELPDAVERLDAGTILFRKIQGLEHDEQYAPLVNHPVFMHICARLYGAHASVSLFRAMIMNKPAGQGTHLPWHQDGGDVWKLDRDPLVTVWVALDPATSANGCVEVIPGSHRLGLLTAAGSTLTDEHARLHCPEERALPLELEAGHGVLMHNWLVHRSGVNPTGEPRRAFTACYMDGRTRSVLTGNHFPLVSGTLDTTPYPFVQQLQTDLSAIQQAHACASQYAQSLEAQAVELRAMYEDAARYARSLEQEREAARQEPASTGLFNRLAGLLR